MARKAYRCKTALIKQVNQFLVCVGTKNNIFIINYVTKIIVFYTTYVYYATSLIKNMSFFVLSQIKKLFSFNCLYVSVSMNIKYF